MFEETVFRSHPFFMMATRSSMSEMKASEDKKKQTELKKTKLLTSIKNLLEEKFLTRA